MARFESRVTGTKIWIVLATASATFLLLSWGCKAAMPGIRNSLPTLGLWQPVDFNFVDRPALSSNLKPVLPPGEVILASRQSVGDEATAETGTWAVPLSGREAGEPVKLLDSIARTVSPRGSYVVAFDGENPEQEIIRLRDRQVVGTIRTYGFVFLDDARIVAFGSEGTHRFGEAKEIDLEARTIRDIPVEGLTVSVSPTFVLNGEIGLCEQQFLEGASGPTCVSTRVLDPATGETREFPTDPEVSVSDDGKYLFTAPSARASRRVGDEVIYWIDEIVDPTNLEGLIGRLRAGAPTGPTPGDRTGTNTLLLVNAIFKTSDDQWVVVDAMPTGDGAAISVCDVATLGCSGLTWASRAPGAPSEWNMIGVLPKTAVTDL